ncbi:MAG: signal peptidase I [Ignavibacteria bacterium CG_4_9_14_3_um_filter_36_18]|nr:signal peptidase I [Ignavibacteria bacterium]PJB00107.1 MAG: signal peptidase I [Ignavibacteria bacterium CG_4_9_14_3_um_filter_36_18]
MSFKSGFKKFIGIKTEEELNKQKTPKEKVRDFIESLLFAAIAAFFIITFVIQNTRIPTGSMENTILVGDFVLVNKFIYGSSSPKYIPFTEIELPYFTLPSLREPRRKDIVVFEYPGHRDQLRADELGVNYVKRCIGLPGDTVQIINKVVYVNGEKNWIPPHIRYGYELRPPTVKRPDIFPRGMSWNEDNWGPIIIPKENYTINLTPESAYNWATTIDREFGRRVVKIENGKVLIDGKPAEKYTFKKDYFFMMGDNRDDSADSRFWGLVPRDLIVGQAFITLFSWDRDIPFTDFFRLLGSIRLDRVLKLLN